MTTQVPAMTRRAVTRRPPRAGLAGGALSVRAWLLLAAGTAGGLVFAGLYLAGGATRAGYRTLLAPPVSALSLGPVHTLFAMMPAGLRERAAGAAIPELTVAVLARLAVTSRAAARARRLGPATGEVA